MYQNYPTGYPYPQTYTNADYTQTSNKMRTPSYNPSFPNKQDERFITGGFLGPFILGGITGGLLAPNFYPRPYPIYPGYPPCYPYCR